MEGKRRKGKGNEGKGRVYTSRSFQDAGGRHVKSDEKLCGVAQVLNFFDTHLWTVSVIDKLVIVSGEMSSMLHHQSECKQNKGRKNIKKRKRRGKSKKEKRNM